MNGFQYLDDASKKAKQATEDAANTVTDALKGLQKGAEKAVADAKDAASGAVDEATKGLSKATE